MLGAQRDGRTAAADERRIRRAGDVEADGRGLGGRERRVERADLLIAGLASRQHGVVARRQLIAAGVTREAIAHRARTGRLHPLHRGVYAVGHLALSPTARDLAAVLASGPRAVLGHRSAAVAWRLLPRRDARVEILCCGPRRDGRPGIVVRRTQALPEADVRYLDGVPVSSPGRTLLDLAATAAPAELERALNEALVRRLVDPAHLLTSAVSRRGARTLRSLLETGPAPTRSEAERRLLTLVRRAGLPRPGTNTRVHGWEVDALWPAERVIVEVDGYAFHAGRSAFERDRRRDAELQAAGFRVLRFTWRQVVGSPEAVVVHLAAVLAR